MNISWCLSTFVCLLITSKYFVSTLECADYLTDEGKTFVNCARENSMFQSEIVDAGRALKNRKVSIEEEGLLLTLLFTTKEISNLNNYIPFQKA